MRLFGRELTISRKGTGILAPVDNRGGWWPLLREAASGDWQKNITYSLDTVLAFHAVFSCVKLISSDIGKPRFKLVHDDGGGIWSDTTSASFSPVLRRPNRYQNHIQFKEWWIISKLTRGNTYALKQRDQRGVVVALYLLDPGKVQPLVSTDGSIYYQLGEDNLTGLQQSVTVPASEIIHDRMCCLFHPLVGLSPIFACGLSATQGLRIQNNSVKFFGNYSRPSGVLTAPGAISDPTADRLKLYWETNFSGENVGKVAVLGDGLKYEPMAMTAVDSQLIEQLKYSAETVCSCFNVPAYKINVGPMPAYNNIEALDQQYYSQCLQTLIESMELCLDEGLALPKDLGVELDLEALLRMDTATRYKSYTDAIAGAWMAPNEARRKEGMPPVSGGDSPMAQQQQFSLAALAERDSNKPFATPTPAALAAPAALPAPADEGDDAKAFAAELAAQFEAAAVAHG